MAEHRRAAARGREDSEAESAYRIRQVEMLVARYRAAERSLVVALAENLGIADEPAELMVRTLIELTTDAEARLVARQPKPVYWNQPVCERCWRVLHPERVAVRAASEIQAEACAFCGFQTRAGIYVREHPHRVPYPKQEPAEEDERPASRARRGS